MPEFVRHSIDNGIAAVVIDRPDLHNAFNEVVIAELTFAMRELGERDDVRVVVLRSEGKSFCAGADIHWMKRMVDYSVEENIADATEMAGMLRAIRECPKPVIARVHGACIGGGVGLAAACDLAVAVKDAVFCLSEVKLGILPAVISPYVLEKIGPGHMRRYAVTAERFDGEEAKRIGLVSDCVEDETALDTWIAKVAKITMGNGPEAVAACKRVLQEVSAAPNWDDKQRITVQYIAERRVSAEGQDGLKAFLEKRKPGWVAS
ncbi:MAG: enoyl-CoA hydratase/isomerase family protein [Phycisphaerales bacterium]|nr:enoyl-CoA hydratase/isomerase family protein [Phycisphaerales bacterium]MCB9856349.1 enoyl-CoA hydratase/isomerase family protein [Phycisphaerales bacterium]MCB9864021.1 enoyl-CoA hydratase/isomerase family protein [Phycisphaerales bacterium]